MIRTFDIIKITIENLTKVIEAEILSKGITSFKVEKYTSKFWKITYKYVTAD